jgi:VWFA-related protein
MMAADRTACGGWARICVAIGIILGCLMTVSSGQENRASATDSARQADNPVKDFKIMVGVEEVRLDTTVQDKKGRQITDLTADDFEIYQDRLPQTITSCIYINDYRPQPLPKVQDRTPGESKTMPPLPAPPLAREEVRRTIVFVVDNLTMSFADVHRARMALRKFVQTQMQPGDIVAVAPTAGGNASLQLFSSDKRHLLSTIDTLRWFIDVRTTQATPLILATSYSVRALSDMPGRKTLILITPKTMLPSPLEAVAAEDKSIAAPSTYRDDAFNPLADAALRAGVVIHTLDIAGLDTPGDIDAERRYNPAEDLNPETHSKAVARRVAIRDSETPVPLSKKTGGLFVKDFNWFVNGIGPADEALKGYYMLTYIPPAGTFEPDSRQRYHRIRVSVKRNGSEVHHRDGFYGIATPPDSIAALDSPLLKAVMSPFRYNDLTINLISGYIDDPQEGSSLKAWFHLDAQNLGVSKEEDGKSYISLEAHAVTTDGNGEIQDSGNVKKKFPVDEDTMPRILEQGITVPIIIPAKKPGTYFVRVGVKDNVSGKMGSAFQYLEIPDLKAGSLALSDIFVINREEDAAWIQSGALVDSDISSRTPRSTMDRSPALKSYLPGERIKYISVIYNATSEMESKPDLESQVFLYGNGVEVFRSEPAAIDLSGVKDPKRIPIQKELLLDNAMPPGDYVLLLRIIDKKAGKKHSVAAKTLNFQIIKL